jgi:hypothetical protein
MNSDYLGSQQVLLGIFITFVVNASQLYFIKQKCHADQELAEDDIGCEISNIQYSWAVF